MFCGIFLGEQGDEIAGERHEAQGETFKESRWKRAR